MGRKTVWYVQSGMLLSITRGVGNVYSVHGEYNLTDFAFSPMAKCDAAVLRWLVVRA